MAHVGAEHADKLGESATLFQSSLLLLWCFIPMYIEYTVRNCVNMDDM